MPGIRLVTGLFLFVLVIGVGCKQSDANNRGFELEREGARRGNEAYRKYQTADYQTAKSALEDHLRFLDQVSSDPNMPDEFRTDAMLTCVRLAKLEEKNHGAGAAAYMMQAVTRCQSQKRPMGGGCSEENIRKLVDRMDQIPAQGVQTPSNTNRLPPPKLP